MGGVLDKQYALAREKKSYLSFRYKERALVAVSVIHKHLPRHDELRVIDFGASEGRTLLEIHKLLGGKGSYTGIEYDRGLIESAPRLPQNVSLIQGDITDLSSVPDESADVITALAVLEHLNDPGAALREAKRILKPGGLFIATAPNPFWDHVADMFKMSTFGGEHHEVDMNEKFFRTITEKANLEYKTFFPFMWVVVGFLPYLKIPVSASFAWKIDKIVSYLKILNWSFVNQCFVAKKRN